MSQQGKPVRQQRFSAAPDLTIKVEDQAFEVYSQPLMLASRVFRAMLESDMQESQEGLIVLESKSKAEFQHVLPWISFDAAGGTREVSAAHVHMLLRWADEFQIEALKNACEECLLQQVPASAEDWHLALECNLEKRAKQCMEKIGADLPSHVVSLGQFADNDVIMEKVWPMLFSAAGAPVPQVEFSMWRPTAKDLWPIIEDAILGPELPLDANNSCNMNNQIVRVIKDSTRLRSLCESEKCQWIEAMGQCCGKHGRIMRQRVMRGPSSQNILFFSAQYGADPLGATQPIYKVRFAGVDDDLDSDCYHFPQAALCKPSIGSSGGGSLWGCFEPGVVFGGFEPARR